MWLRLKDRDRPAIRSLRAERLYLTLSAGKDGLDGELTSIAAEPWKGAAMVAGLDRLHCERAKYDEFLPESLLKEGFVADHLDVTGAEARFRQVLERTPCSATSS